MLVLPDTTAELATQRGEELSKAVALTDVKYQGRLLEPMVLSYGVATFPDNGRTLKDLLRASDNALFRAKDEGRDAVRSPGQFRACPETPCRGTACRPRAGC